MPAEIELTHEFPELQELYRTKRDQWAKLAMAAVEEGAELGERLMKGEIKRAKLVGVTGQLWNSVTSTVGVEGEVPVAWIRPEAPYAQVMDEGRRAGAKQPPSGPLELWGRRKLGVEGLGYVLARSIKAKSIKGRQYVAKTEKALGKAMPKIVNRLIAEWIADDG